MDILILLVIVVGLVGFGYLVFRTDHPSTRSISLPSSLEQFKSFFKEKGCDPQEVLKTLQEKPSLMSRFSLENGDFNPELFDELYETLLKSGALFTEEDADRYFEGKKLLNPPVSLNEEALAAGGLHLHATTSPLTSELEEAMTEGVGVTEEPETSEAPSEPVIHGILTNNDLATSAANDDGDDDEADQGKHGPVPTDGQQKSGGSEGASEDE